MASCQKETQAYRMCLKENQIHRKGASKCNGLAKTLEACRDKFRRANKIGESQFDSTRVLSNPKCLPLNQKVQHCLKWRKGSKHLCKDDIFCVHGQGKGRCGRAHPRRQTLVGLQKSSFVHKKTRSRRTKKGSLAAMSWIMMMMILTKLRTMTTAGNESDTNRFHGWWCVHART
jgi:hypothetical protein